jgi:hypothetical protein
MFFTECKLTILNAANDSNDVGLGFLALQLQTGRPTLSGQNKGSFVRMPVQMIIYVRLVEL